MSDGKECPGCKGTVTTERGQVPPAPLKLNDMISFSSAAEFIEVECPNGIRLQCVVLHQKLPVELLGKKCAASVVFEKRDLVALPNRQLPVDESSKKSPVG